MDVNTFNSNGIDPIIKLIILGFIIALLLILAIILLLIYPLILFIILSLIPWVLISISRFNFFINKKTFFYIIPRILFGEEFLLAITFAHRSQFLTGIGVYIFYVAVISFLSAFLWLAYSISKDKSIIKLIMGKKIL